MLQKCCAVVLAAVLLLCTGCYRIKKSSGGGQHTQPGTRTPDPQDILLPPGYKTSVVAAGFTFPTDAVVDEQGNLYVLESGYTYGEAFTTPRLLKIVAGGQPQVIASGTNNGPWTGVEYHDGQFYIAEGGVMEGGRILRVTPGGVTTPLVSGLPSFGDHHTNGPVMREGQLYFSIGTATNSGIVGSDNAAYGWLQRKPAFHDIACRDIVLSGFNAREDNPLTTKQGDTAVTGPFLPFGTSASPGQVIRGQVPCSGAILRMPLGGGDIQLVAWGLRNPFGLAFSPGGQLYTTENGFDERGARPVWGAGDVLWAVKEGSWYGWPDFSAGKPVAADEEFSPKKKATALQPLLQQYPNTPPKPAAVFAVHASANGFDFSRSAGFGFKGEAFVAQFGDMAPEVGKVWSPVGFKVVRVDVASGIVRDFAVNKGRRNGPASMQGHGGLERPVAAVFDPSGNNLYVVDFGQMGTSKDGVRPQKGSGVVWKISKQ